MSDFINIHVFEGASQSSNQSIPFSAARGQILSEYGEIVRFTHLNVDQINFELKWQPKEVIDWCLSGDIFIATSHFHQGLETQRWIISELWSEYERLRDMIAFPAGEDCPIFLQDKMRNFTPLSKEDYLPSFKIDIDWVVEENLEDVFIPKLVYEELQSFLSKYKDNKFVVKTPCTTHGSKYSGRIYCKDKEEVLERIAFIIRRSNKMAFGPGNQIDKDICLPYLFVQVRAPSNKEKKVLVLNGEAKMLVQTLPGTYVKGASFDASLQELFLFAEKVVKDLKAVYPETITEFLIRVDIFCVDGKLKVNEFESFDALWLSESSRNNTIFPWSDLDTNSWLVEFWYNKIKYLIKQFQERQAEKKKGV